MKKRILSLLLALVMVLTILPTVALAEGAPTMSGTCGASGNENNVKWELTDVDGDGNYTLTISGTGAMADYTGWQSQPWKGYANQITRFVVEDGVTNISKFATNGETKIEEYIIGKDVAEIGTFGVSADSAKEFVVDSANTSFKVADGAILTADGTTLVAYPGGRASVEEYAIPSTVTTILGGAFNGADMQRLLVPNSVKSIPNWSFQGCSAAYVEINMENVPGYAFTNFLSALKELRFREDVKTIDRHAFGFTSKDKDGSLEKVKFDSSELPTVNVKVNGKVNDYGQIFIKQNKLTTVDLSACSSFNGSYKNAFQGTNAVCIGFYFNTAESAAALKKIDDNYWTIKKIFADNAVFAVLNGGMIPSWEGWYKDNFELVTPIRDGYKFEGWYESEDFSGSAVTDASVGKTYYAKWTEDKDDSIYGQSKNVDLGTIAEGGSTSATVGFTGTIALDRAESDRGYFTADISGMTVTVAPADGLKPGTYRDTIYVYTETGATHFIYVTLTVTEKSADADQPQGDLPFWLPAAIGSNPFSDVAGGAYYNEAVRWAVKYGIASGTDAKHFSPDAACTRGQAVTFLWRAAGCPAPALAENPFADVKPTDYCYDAVLWAVQTGVAKGTSRTTFSPDAPCTRGQIVTFLYRAAGSPSGYGNSGYTDVPETSYCAAPVAWAVALRVTSGTSAITFSPDAICTRAQIVTFLYRANA